MDGDYKQKGPLIERAFLFVIWRPEWDEYGHWELNIEI
jgi:hypothetical protein